MENFLIDGSGSQTCIHLYYLSLSVGTRHFVFYCSSLYHTPQMLRILQIEGKTSCPSTSRKNAACFIVVAWNWPATSLRYACIAVVTNIATVAAWSSTHSLSHCSVSRKSRSAWLVFLLQILDQNQGVTQPGWHWEKPASEFLQAVGWIKFIGVEGQRSIFFAGFKLGPAVSS